MAILSIKNLEAGYADFDILKKVNLELKEGTISVLMGPNGAGKSTLLKSIYSLTHITGGEIIFQGRTITGFPAHKLLGLNVAFVTQGKINFGLLSVKENLLMGAYLVSDKQEINQRLEDVYTQFPVLRQKQKQYAFALSGGEQQMLAIGRALMSRPALLLMDEPSLGLSPKLVKDMFSHIIGIRDSFNTTILIVEHNIKSLLECADYGFILVNGTLIASDTCENLKDSELMKKVFIGKFD